MAKKKKSTSPKKGKACSTKTYPSSKTAEAVANGIRAVLPKSQRKKVTRSKNKVTICK